MCKEWPQRQGRDASDTTVWPSLFDQLGGVILGAQMIACRGKVQKGDGIIHLVAEHLVDQTDMLRKIGGLDEAFEISTSRGDEAKHGSGTPDPREAKLKKARDIFIPDLHIDTITSKAGISVRALAFRASEPNLRA